MSKSYPRLTCPDTAVHSGGYTLKFCATIHLSSNARHTMNTVLHGGATKESNFEMLDGILKEVCELFPSQYIHVGGDEVSLSQWKNCPDCMAYMNRHGYTDAHKLEDYFMARIEKILAKYGANGLPFGMRPSTAELFHRAPAYMAGKG